MSDHSMGKRILDARPDRMDFRDLEYRPPLVSLPESFPTAYEIGQFLPILRDHKIVLNQGSEGACTGYGLAVVVNYIYWNRALREARRQVQAVGGPEDETEEEAVARRIKDVGPPKSVSPHMLYDLARIYDEWDGEDYSGSSCRGALKGWHKHGVCERELWTSGREKKRPKEAWREDAATRPLGAYYRVDQRSIGDLQAAIFEVRAVYCSARVHEGWQPDALDNAFEVAPGVLLPKIPWREEITGGHAFAMVGYTPHGFIIQNSWGPNWGMGGFAILSYEDWARNGNDAWVAALAAPMSVAPEAISTSRTDTALALASSMLRPEHDRADAESGVLPPPDPWTASRAYEHSVVMGNDGKLIRRRVDTIDSDDNLHLVAFEKPLEAARSMGYRHVMLFAHGGLNSESAAIERVMRLGPWLHSNDIYPIFLVWKTSLLESLGNIGKDFVGKFNEQRDELRTEALGGSMQAAIGKLQSRFDKAFEAAAEAAIGKPVWSQIKLNAQAASNRQGGARKLVRKLDELHKTLEAEGRPLDLHIVGHSAGAILLGHMLDDMRREGQVSTATLFAPACSMEFAARHYGSALTRGALRNGALHIDNLSEENERRDTVGPYGKSLLYLVSRALEDPRKRPLLGLSKCWDRPEDAVPDERAYLGKLKDKLGADFAESELKHVRDWHRVVDRHGVDMDRHGARDFLVKIEAGDENSRKTVSASHGDIDNTLDIMNAAVARILGVDAPPHPISDLSGF